MAQLAQLRSLGSVDDPQTMALVRAKEQELVARTRELEQRQQREQLAEELAEMRRWAEAASKRLIDGERLDSAENCARRLEALQVDCSDRMNTSKVPSLDHMVPNFGQFEKIKFLCWH